MMWKTAIHSSVLNTENYSGKLPQNLLHVIMETYHTSVRLFLA